MKDHEPDHVAVALDRPEPTFRHEMTPTYKAQRESAPDILRQQMGLVREVLEAMAIPTLETVGFEADDIIATLATQGRDRGDDVIIVTGDRDSYQLVEDPHIRVLYNKRGVSDYALYDEAGILERTGVRPVDYVQYAAPAATTRTTFPGSPASVRRRLRSSSMSGAVSMASTRCWTNSPRSCGRTWRRTRQTSATTSR